MIYEGKEYKAVTDGSAGIGDLLSTTKVSYKDGQFSHFDELFYFALDNEQHPLTERIMQNGSRIQAYPPKPFKRYRLINQTSKITNQLGRVEESNKVEFNEGDRVKIVGESWNGVFAYIGLSGVIRDEADCDGDYTVDEIGPYSNYGQYPPSSLELIENNAEKAHRELKKTIIKINKEMIKHLKKSKRVQELTLKVGSSPITLAHAASYAQRETLEGASVSHAISRSNDAIDAMRYGFEKLGKTLKRPSLSDNVNDLFTEIKDIIVAKNENYGDSFSKQYQKYGMISVEMRLNDKFMRLEQLVAGEKDKVGESIEDTLKDIIGYATLALIELEGEK